MAQAVAGNELEEVVVSATRRTENLQDVPIAITALTGSVLSELNVQTLEDFIRYLPNVSIAGVAPGQNEIYMRGLATTHQGSQGSSSLVPRATAGYCGTWACRSMSPGKMATRFECSQRIGCGRGLRARVS